MISTRDLSELPDVDSLRRLMRSLAMLDAIICPEWQYRWYSFSSVWAPGEQMGSMRNGSGDEYSAHFSAAGCWIKGFAHEYEMSPYREQPPTAWPGILEMVPPDFAACLREPGFSIENVTFCIWRRYTDPTWQVGSIDFPPDHPDPDGSEWLLSILDGQPETYRAYAGDYFGREVPLTAVEHVYRQGPLTSELVAQLNSDLSLDEIRADATEIGYPESDPN